MISREKKMAARRTIALAVSLLFLGAGCFSSDAVRTPGVSGGVIDLSGRGLTAVPGDVFDGTGVVELDLSDNALTGALPSEIGRLTSLTSLDASGNRMTGVPAEVGQLSRLEELDLSDNQLTGLPLELGNLQQLKRLDLSGNEGLSEQDLAAIAAKLPETTVIVR